MKEQNGCVIDQDIANMSPKETTELSPELKRILEEEQEEADEKVILDMAKEEFPSTTVEEIEKILSDPSKDAANKQNQ